MLGKQHTKAAVAAVSALALAACGVTAWQLTGQGAPEQLNAWQVRDVTDGLNRVVVRVDPAVYSESAVTSDAAASGTSSGSSARRPDAVGGAGTDGKRIDFARLARAQAELGGHGSVGVDDQGRIAWIVGDRSIPVGTGSPQSGNTAPGEAGAPARGASPDATTPRLTVARQAAVWLRTQPWVSHAQPTHSGDVLVATALTAREVAGQDGVADATESASVPVASINAPNDQYWTQSWHLQNTGWASGQDATAGADVGAVDAWPYTQGEGSVVAVLDTGYYSPHPDLAGSLWTNPDEVCGGTTDTDGNGYAGDCHGWNFYAGNTDIDNGAGGEHGTTVAGAIAAQLDNGIGGAGLAPKTTIMPLVVGSGTVVDLTLATEAIYYAVDHGADVVNASFGGALGSTALANLKDAVGYARSHGTLVVAAAGNDNVDRDGSPMYPASLDDEGLVTVGASDATDQRAGFSAWGKTSVDLFAPGRLVLTTFTDGGYRLVSGTSIATPLVSAAAALARSADPSLTPAQLRTALMDSGDHPASLAKLSVSGARLSAAGLLAGALTYTVDAGAGMVADQASAVTVTATGSASVTSPSMRLTVAYRQDGYTWAVAGVPIGTGAETLTTGEDGTIEVPVTGSPLDVGATATVDLTLPSGDFALVSQLMSDRAPAGRPAMVVLPVRSPADGSAPTPTTSSPAGGGSTPTAPSTTPAGPVPSGTAPSGGSGPDAPAPSTTTAPAPSATTTSGPVPAPSTTTTHGSGPAPSTTGGSGPSPTTATTTPGPAPSSAPTTWVTTAPTGGSTSGSSDHSSGGTSSPTPSTSDDPASGSSPTPTPTRSYDGSNAFGITSLSPSTVATAGGTLVTVTGTDLPSGVAVLVGGAPATVMGGHTATRLSFYSPARIAGTYDVAIMEYPGTAKVTLVKALTYADPGSSGSGGSGDGGSGATSGPSPTSSTGTDASAPGPTQPSTAKGPGGLRLVRSDTLSVLTASAWASAPRCAGRCRAISL